MKECTDVVAIRKYFGAVVCGFFFINVINIIGSFYA
jgi:hypothetical protein